MTDSRPGLDPDVLRRVLRAALANGGEYADVFFEHRVIQSVRLQSGAIHEAGIIVTRGAGVRVLSGERAGYGFTDDLRPEALLRAAQTASLVARSGSRDNAEIDLREPGRERIYEGALDETRDHSALFADYLARADVAARATDPRIRDVNGSMSAEVQDVQIATSDGVLAYDRRPMVTFAIQTVAVDGPLRGSGSYGDGGRTDLSFYDTTTPEQIARESARIASASVDAVPAPAGEMPVVVGAGGGGVLLHEAVGHGLESDFNRQGTSLYAGRVGERVASDLVTIYDDGNLPGERGSIAVDDEGNPGAHKVLVERGILRGYMQDVLNARLMGTTSTGSGRRQSFRVMPQPRMCNTYMAPGSGDAQEIIGSIDRGIYARSFSGGQVEISKGDFVFMVAEGYLIENGKLTTPIRGATLVGNGPEIMTKVVAVGGDARLANGQYTCGKAGQLVPVGVGLPTLAISRMTVGGANVA